MRFKTWSRRWSSVLSFLGIRKPSKERVFFETLGRLVISWSYLEAGLDYAVIIIHDKLNGRNISPHLPRSLNRRLKFLTRAANEIPELAPYKDRILNLVAEVNGCKEDRHNAIHAFLMENPPKGLEKVKMSRLMFEDDIHTYKETSLGIMNLAEQGLKFGQVANLAINLTIDLMHKFAPKDRN